MAPAVSSLTYRAPSGPGHGVGGAAPAAAVGVLESGDQGDRGLQRVLRGVPRHPQDGRGAGRLAVPRAVHRDDGAARPWCRDGAALQEGHAERGAVGREADLDRRQGRAIQVDAARVGDRVGHERHVGQRPGRMVLVLVGVAVRPSQVPPGGDPGDLVGRMLVDVGLDDLPEGVGVPGIGRVERVGHVVALVHRGPHRAVGGHRQALAVAHPGLDHAQVMAVRAARP